MKRNNNYIDYSLNHSFIYSYFFSISFSCFSNILNRICDNITLHYIQKRPQFHLLQVVFDRHRLNRSLTVSIYLILLWHSRLAVRVLFSRNNICCFLLTFPLAFRHYEGATISGLFFRKWLVINAIQRNHALRKHVQPARLKADCILLPFFSISPISYLRPFPPSQDFFVLV